MKLLRNILPLVLLFELLLGCSSCSKSQQLTDRKIPSEVQKRLSKDLVSRSEQVMQGSPKWFEILDSAILLDPTNASAFREESVWYTKTGDYVNAYALLNKAVELDPFDALGYRGWLKLYKLHDFEGALFDFNKLDSLTPGVMDYAWGENINYVKGIAESELGMSEQALADFNCYIDEVKKKQGESWVDLYAFIDKGVVLRKMNKVDSAVLNFDKAIKYYESCPEAYFEKGITFMKVHDYKSAIHNLNKSLELFKKGYARNDPYKDYSNQLYVEDIEKQISNCTSLMNTNKN